MPILMIGESPRLTADEYARVLDHLEPALRSAPGFLMHGARALAEGAYRTRGKMDRTTR